ncbi:MAG: FAD-binding oxidoreductase [Caldilineae bacterium]|nr:MAG: FAD-binding oxidoreductase [Caldilineae bacterium]
MPTAQSELLADFRAELERRTGGTVRTDPYSRVLYSTDASIYRVMPQGVFFPRHADDVQAAVELAAQYRLPLTMRGAGTSLAGQAVNHGLIVDASRHMNQILEVNTEAKWVRLQPGVVLDDLNAHLKPLGLQYGPDPASGNRATLGGIVSNNSTGAHSIVYGMTADHVLQASVVLSDGTATTFGAVEASRLPHLGEKEGREGEIYRRLPAILSQNEAAIRAGTPRHWRRCGGYNLDRLIGTDTLNLAKLVCGAEGTLAALTDITLNLVERPKHTVLGIVHFDAMRPALEAVPRLLETGPSAIELMDNLGLTLCRNVPEYARLLTFLEGEPDTILITEFTGNTEAEARGKLDNLLAFLRRHRIGVTCVRAEAPEMQARVWKVRKVGLGLLMSIKGDHKPIPFIEDCAVPVDHLAEYIHRIEDFCHSLDVRVAYYAHASAGCLHVRPLINLKEAEQAEKMKAIARAAADLVAEYGGAFSSEHGDGRARSWLNEHFYGPDLYNAFRQVKTLFDPDDLLNPGIIVNAGPMDENLRYGAAYTVIPLKEHLDFSADMGFHRAVEMCNGAGVCRKGNDTMCPSFMVTREEEHSTRGRANLLRAAFSGALPPEEFTSPRMFDALDLCVECKACKAECPSSVDMAKIKTEFLAHYYEVHPIPLRARLFAHIATLSRLASGPLAPLANWTLRNGLIRRGMERWLGIDRRRPLPSFARQPFTAWFKRHTPPADASERKTVVLFNDTFNTYNHPQVAIAAVEVLEAAGYGVVLPGHRCCGRPMISKGLVEAARAAAAQTIARLHPFARQGLPIIGLEPSCISALRDDYFALLPGDSRVAEVAAATRSFEEFIAAQADDPAFRLPLEDSPARILLHGHCHQKALIGTEAAHKTLHLLPNAQVTEVDSGCCGMAGAFGYEAEHHDISLAMAERRLLPAVRRAGDDTLLVAAGTSCRQQIWHGTHREALHPAQVLRRALKPGA